MPNAQINGIDLYYEIHGNGNPLLLVAGLASDSQSWQPVIGELARNFLVITPDNRGVGRTQPQDAPMDIGRIAHDCIGLLNHLGIKSAHLLGHSMGGMVALDMALRHPDRIDRLILAATSSSNSMRNNALLGDMATCMEEGMDPAMWFRNIFYWIFTPGFFENKAALDEALRYALEYPYPQGAAAFRNQVNALAGFDCTDSLPRIRAETLVIAGKEDLLFPPGACSVPAQGIPGAAFLALDNAAHSIHMERPGPFADHVMEFLAHN